MFYWEVFSNRRLHTVARAVIIHYQQKRGMGGFLPYVVFLWYVVVYALVRRAMQRQAMVIYSVFKFGFWMFSGYMHVFVVEIINFARA